MISVMRSWMVSISTGSSADRRSMRVIASAEGNRFEPMREANPIDLLAPQQRLDLGLGLLRSHDHGADRVGVDLAGDDLEIAGEQLIECAR